MNAIGTFPGLIGFYVLTPEGQLGCYDQKNNFVVDTRLTTAFADYNQHYLVSYLRNPQPGHCRLAIIYRTREKKPWGSETLLLEKHIVRRLYPVTGMTTEVELTAFQRKNREKSLYRGMELFLEYQDSSSPGMPVYCPVLYDRDTTLDDYASLLDRPITSADREAPVVEVMNLLAGIPLGRRLAPEITILKEKIYHRIVKKDLRKSAEFTFIEDIRRHALAAKAEDTRPDDPYGNVDKRAERQVTLEAVMDSQTMASGIRANEGALPAHIQALLVGRPEAADPMMLKAFAKFRNLDREKLEALAAQSLVYQVPPGTKLLDHGTHDTWNLYLLEGTVRLVAADGVEKFIEGGTDQALSPVSYLKPRMYTAMAVTRVAFLWLDDKWVDQVMQGGTAPLRRDATA